MNKLVHLERTELGRLLRTRLAFLQPAKPEPLAATVDPMDRNLPGPPRWRKGALIGGVTAGALGIGLWIILASRDPTYLAPISSLTIASVSQADFEDFLAVRAAVAPFETHYIATPDGGTVQKVLVEDGAAVESGQPLVVLTNSTLQSQIAARQADIAAQVNALDAAHLQLQDARFTFARTLLDIDYQLTRLKGQLERDKVLLAGNAIAPATYKEEEEEYAHELQIRAETVSARDTQEKIRKTQTHQIEDALLRLSKNMRLAQESLDALTVVAPVAGQLTGLSAVVGQSKTAGAIIGQVDSRDRFKLVADVDEFYLRRIYVNQEALFFLGQGEAKASVAKVHPQVNDGAFRVDLYIQGQTPESLRNGQAVDLKIELGGVTKAVVLPNGPFYQQTGGRWVFVLSPDGKSASRREVRFGRRNPQYLEVESGLTPGERVIVSSYQSFEKIQRLTLLPGTPAG